MSTKGRYYFRSWHLDPKQQPGDLGGGLSLNAQERAGAPGAFPFELSLALDAALSLGRGDNPQATSGGFRTTGPGTIPAKSLGSQHSVAGASLLFPRGPRGPAAETVNRGCQSLPWMESWDVLPPRAKSLLRRGDRAQSHPRRALTCAVLSHLCAERSRLRSRNQRDKSRPHPGESHFTGGC